MSEVPIMYLLRCQPDIRSGCVLSCALYVVVERMNSHLGRQPWTRVFDARQH